MTIQKIIPFLWYAKEAEEAAAFYASDRAKAKRVTDTMMKMVKFDIAALKAAYLGTSAYSR